MSIDEDFRLQAFLLEQPQIENAEMKSLKKMLMVVEVFRKIYI